MSLIASLQKSPRSVGEIPSAFASAPAGTLVNQITEKSFNRVPFGTRERVETSKTDIMPPLNVLGWFPLG